jgi:hypothetical protein
VALSETTTARRLPERVLPSRWDAFLFQLKVAAFRTARFVREIDRGPARLTRGAVVDGMIVIAESRTPLWGDPRPGEHIMQQGKVQNLRAAARRLDRTVLPAGAVFSFWKQTGRASARRGFVTGRMLQGGCLVPATGGGLCQLSNALYDMALRSGCTIVERHAHSRVVPGAVRERDATVAWNYVDLRFSAPQDMLLRVVVERDDLLVQFLAPSSPPPRGEVGLRSNPGGGRDASKRPPPEALRASTSPRGGGEKEVRTCGTCNEVQCFRHEQHCGGPAGRTAYLVDENWPEFRKYVRETRKSGDVLALPLDGGRWHAARYAWDTHEFARIEPATLTAIGHSLALRFAKDGPARRAVELRCAERLAQRLARSLTPDVTDVVVAQSLLPYLWRDGHLGGRRFTVLMTRMPMAEIQARLNAAAARHPERKSLADFRADPALIDAEREALAQADAIVTPHTEIAALFGERAIRLDWHHFAPRPRDIAAVPNRIAFAGPTIARKGAYELREAARTLDLEVVLLGSELEGAVFWSGVRTRKPETNWLNGVSAVVQPALLEDAPRRLLMALASGVPVIATPACGLPSQPGLTLVPPDDVPALAAVLHPFMSEANWRGRGEAAGEDHARQSRVRSTVSLSSSKENKKRLRA